MIRFLRRILGPRAPAHVELDSQLHVPPHVPHDESMEIMVGMHIPDRDEHTMLSDDGGDYDPYVELERMQRTLGDTLNE